MVLRKEYDVSETAFSGKGLGLSRIAKLNH
jgi:hypothetical protein